MTKAKATPKTPVKKKEIPEPKNVHEAINHVMGRVGYVQKEASKNLKYTFASEKALIEAVRPHMVDVGLIFYQSGAELIQRNETVASSGSKGINVLFKFEWTWVHVPSESSIIVTSIGEGTDYGDKAANKAMTIAMKYNMRQTLIIETGDDPDTTPSTEFEQARDREAIERQEVPEVELEGLVGTKQWPAEKAIQLRGALIGAEILPEDCHNYHLLRFLDMSPFSVEVSVTDFLGWAKLYRDYKIETKDTDEAVRMATEAWGAGDPA